MKVLAFAAARDAVGASTIDVEVVAPLSARALLERICEAYPALAPYASSIRVAINGTYARWDDLVHEGDEVALIPPVAGGC